MRNCQICGSSSRQPVELLYQRSPYILFACGICGHRYADSVFLSQRVLDDYYLNVYQTDDKPYSNDRLNSLAECVKSYSMRVLDIGGTDGELQARLGEIGVICDVSGVGGGMEWRRYDGVILSHTLEHIYDIHAMMERIKYSLFNDGYLFVEVPIHPSLYLPPADYDYGWQHINKFRTTDLLALFQRYGFQIIESIALPDYVNELQHALYHCWRLVAKRA